MLSNAEVVSLLTRELFWNDDLQKWDVGKELKSCADFVELAGRLLSDTGLFRESVEGKKGSGAQPIYRVWVDVEECRDGEYEDIDVEGGPVAICKDEVEAREIAEDLMGLTSYEPYSAPTEEEIAAADAPDPEEGVPAARRRPETRKRRATQRFLWGGRT